MNTPNEHSEALEQLIDRTLRAQPLIKAPNTLEARVWAQIEQRATLAWWKGSFVHWPIPARAVFLLATLVVVKFVLKGAMWLMDGLRAAPITETLSEPVTWIYTLRDIFSSIATAGMYVLNSFPTYWLYAGALASVATYVAFFGLGAAVYRMLYK